MWRLLPTITILTAVFSLGFSTGERGRNGNAAINSNVQLDRRRDVDESFSDDTDNRQASENSFYPSYSSFQNQPLGHSRPFFYNQQQETAYSQRTPYQNNFDNSGRFSGYKDSYILNNNNNAALKTDHESILGSGNFGVITGGTFYSDNDNENSKFGNYDSFSHNGHGKPSFYFGSQSNPKQYQQEQFENFKDFADINTQNDRQYSQYVVVYAPNKNDSNKGAINREEKMVTKTVPKNIIESLTLIDLEHPTAATVPEKKLSLSKRKLALLQPEKKHLQKITKTKSRELEEPLLALS